MTATLEPGQIVTHPEHGIGLAARAQDGSRVVLVAHYSEMGVEGGLDWTYDLTGWQPVTNHRCKPTQPDEPTQPGSKVTILGKRLVRADDHANDRWVDIDNGDSWDWWALRQFGTISLGWDGER